MRMERVGDIDFAQLQLSMVYSERMFIWFCLRRSSYFYGLGLFPKV